MVNVLIRRGRFCCPVEAAVIHLATGPDLNIEKGNNKDHARARITHSSMAFPTSSYHHGDSDADDEYERSVVISPRLADDSETSPIDSEPPSAENTPRTFGHTGDDHSSPKSSIIEWSSEETANFAAGLGLKQYRDSFIGE